jgi:hypothetical protein
MHPGYITRGQGCCVGARWGVIVRHAAEVDGEQFVVVRFRGGEEQLVSVFELAPTVQSPEVFDETTAEIEEQVAADVEDEVTPEIEVRRATEDRDSDEPEDGSEETEFDEETEMAEDE